MRILVVCQYYYPEPFRITDICETLVQRGHEVSVLTGLPNYPSGKIPQEYRWCKKRNETINGVKVKRCFEIGRRPGAIGLILNYASYMLSASWKALFLKKDFDVIFVYQLSPATMILPAVILKKRSHKPLFLYCLDLWPESLKILLPNGDSHIFRMTQRFCRYLYGNCERIAVTSKPFIDYMRQVHVIPEARLLFMPQHAEESYLDMNLDSEDNGITDFIFMGNIGLIQDIETILAAVEQINDVSSFKVHFVGDGSFLETAKSTVEEKKMQDIVVFHGRHPLEAMQDFYRIADVCLLTLKADNLTGLTTPGKLQGYMAAGKPVIGAINGSAQDIIKESQCGICVNAGDFVSLAKVMQDFIEGKEKYANCGNNGREYFRQHFTRDIFMEHLEGMLCSLVSWEK